VVGDRFGGLKGNASSHSGTRLARSVVRSLLPERVDKSPPEELPCSNTWPGAATRRFVLVVALVLESVFLPGLASILRTGVQIDFCPENTDFVPKARPATLRVAMRAGTTGLSPGFNPGYG
jgi:hypothetical protein